MYYSPSGMDQYSWSDIPDMPYILPSSHTTPNDRSRCPPQIQHDLHDSAPTPFDENQFRDLPSFYAPPFASISSSPVAGDVSDAFNPLHIYSTNVSLPPPQTRPQFVFGGIQSPFAFDFSPSWPTPVHPPAQFASLSVVDSPAVSTDQASFSPDSELADLVSWAYPTPSESTPSSTPDSAACKEGLQVPATSPRPEPFQRSSTRRSSKKRKISHSDSEDGSRLLQCCMTVKPESLARHLKSDGHKRNACLPLDRPEVCSVCNIAFARQDARNRHFRSQHGVKIPPDARSSHESFKRPSAAHPSTLPKRRK
ncbi:hypothetical protein BGW80DRAFT_1556243 [Lactifluus volemus]|nr:hypothetical protein BGW80DRAFT_1556243 [Lactifluus volemus]